MMRKAIKLLAGAIIIAAELLMTAPVSAAAATCAWVGGYQRDSQGNLCTSAALNNADLPAQTITSAGNTIAWSTAGYKTFSLTTTGVWTVGTNFVIKCLDAQGQTQNLTGSQVGIAGVVGPNFNGNITQWVFDISACQQFEIVPNGAVTGTLTASVHAAVFGQPPYVLTITSVYGHPGVVPLDTNPVLGEAIYCNQSAPVNISTATTTEVIPQVGSNQILICGYFLQIVSGTSPTLQFEYGTKTTTGCDTGTTVQSGTFSGTGIFAQFGGGGNTPLRTPGGKDWCIVTTGTNPNVQGYVTYSQFVPN